MGRNGSGLSCENLVTSSKIFRILTDAHFLHGGVGDKNTEEQGGRENKKGERAPQTEEGIYRNAPKREQRQKRKDSAEEGGDRLGEEQRQKALENAAPVKIANGKQIEQGERCGNGCQKG